MAGTVDLVLRCYSGIESRNDILWFNPSLPSELKCLEFGIRYRRNSINVRITDSKINLCSHKSRETPVKIGLGDKTFSLSPGQSIELEIKD